MDAVHVSGGRDDAITDPFPTEEPSQSEIPEVSSRCPESDSGGSQMCSVAKDANQADCCSPVKPHSSHRGQLRPTQSSAYESPPSKTCICQKQTVLHTTSGQPNSIRQEEFFTGPVKIIQSCRSSSHPPSCHDETKYHCFHGSHDGIEQKHIQHHMVTIRDDEFHRIPRRYSQIIVEYPVTVLICCMVVLFACSLAGIFTGGLPDFSDPMSGFEPRGTDISIRLATWTRLQESTGTGKSLSTLPWQLSKRTAGQTSSKPEVGRLSKKILQRDFAEQNFFCNAPGEKYAQLVFRSGNSASLWSLKAIYSMCQMEQTQICSGSEFDNLCQSRTQLETSTEKNECCPSWSLGNYLALLNNVSSCFSLTAQQVSESLGLLRICAPYYHDGSLVAACTERSKSGRCGSVPHRCKRLSIFQILHYMVDKDFLGPQTVEYKVPSLKYSVVFLPVEKGEPLMKIYLDHLEGHKVMYNTTTTITGMDFGLKQKLFKYYLAWDSFYPVLAVLALLFTMSLYLKSIFLAAMSLVSVVLSLLTSYFFYKVAFHITLFPLLNLASVLVLLGSCLNHTLTFVDFWKLQVAQNPQVVIEKRMYQVLQEMGYLIVVSGLTSSITFYSGYISSITAIRCYALFLGSASLINTTFALVWLPCVLILQERHVANASTPVTKALRNPCFSNSAGFWETSSRRRCLFTLRQKLRMLGQGLSDMLDLLFLKILPCGVVKFRYIWICWFAVLAAGGTYITCVDPGMKLTTLDSRTTQLFRSSHPFERFDAEYRHQFMFERRSHGEDKPMTLTLIWGVVPSDDRDHFDPSSNGSLHLDPDFNMSCPEAQVWLRDLCRKVHNQTFYTTLSADQGTSQDNVCFVERLIHWVSIRRCSESEDALSFCCNNIPFPYSPEVFEQCLTMMVAEQHAEGLSASTGGLRFDTDGHIIGLVVILKTEQLYSFNFTRMSQFYHDVQSWFNQEIAKAPIGLRKGWFVSQFGLYDLQQCLSSETLEVAGFSVALTFALLLLTTWNIPLSLYVSITVGGSVFATVGLLVLLEWQLNGVEALFISAAAGLSVDFVANYCISYSLAPHPDRLGRVAHSLKRMGCPVAAGAGAFFCVGVIMLPATALLFRKLGIFLLLVKCVACGFATFFFQSLCCFFGPQKNCGVITVPCVTRNKNILSNTETGVGSGSNGAFGCEAGSRVRRKLRKGGEDFLCPTQDHHRQRQMVAGREPEQYELQPLAYQLSDSFENSTCTSKLSNRPSVLSDEIHFCGLSPRHSCDQVGVEADSDEICSTDLRDCTAPPALQTSSPYKDSTLCPVAFKSRDASIEVLCKKCQVRESCGLHLWNSSTSSCSSTDEIMITQTTDTVNKKSLPVEEASSSHLHKCLLSFQSEISAAKPEDSNETHLGDAEAAFKAIKAKEELQPGHLNGKRDTLRLSLKETVYDMVSPGSRTTQGNKPVILPNSKPDMPDVWIKREGKGDGSS